MCGGDETREAMMTTLSLVQSQLSRFVTLARLATAAQEVPSRDLQTAVPVNSRKCSVEPSPPPLQAREPAAGIRSPRARP